MVVYFNIMSNTSFIPVMAKPVLSFPFICRYNNGFLCMPSCLKSLLMHFQRDELFPPDSAISWAKYAVFVYCSFLNI